MMASRTAPDLVSRARRYAAEVHAGDVRKGTGAPYFEGHLEPVAQIVAEHGGSEVQVAAAYLHDTAEDHGGVRRLRDLEQRFGPEVATIVEHLSDSLVDTDAGEVKAPWRERKLAHIASLATRPAATLEVAAADKLHNATTILVDLRTIGPELWQRFTVHDPADHLWYYDSLATVIAATVPGHVTAVALCETVDELAAEVGDSA